MLINTKPVVGCHLSAEQTRHHSDVWSVFWLWHWDCVERRPQSTLVGQQYRRSPSSGALHSRWHRDDGFQVRHFTFARLHYSATLTVFHVVHCQPLRTSIQLTRHKTSSKMSATTSGSKTVFKPRSLNSFVSHFCAMQCFWQANKAYNVYITRLVSQSNYDRYIASTGPLTEWLLLLSSSKLAWPQLSGFALTVSLCFHSDMYEGTRPAIYGDIQSIMELLRPLEESGVLVNRPRQLVRFEDFGRSPDLVTVLSTDSLTICLHKILPTESLIRPFDVIICV